MRAGYSRNRGYRHRTGRGEHASFAIDAKGGLRTFAAVANANGEVAGKRTSCWKGLMFDEHVLCWTLQAEHAIYRYTL